MSAGSSFTNHRQPGALNIIVGFLVVGIGLLGLLQVSLIGLAQLRAESVARQGARIASLQAGEDLVAAELVAGVDGNVFSLDDWNIINNESSIEVLVSGRAYSLILVDIDVSASSKIGILSR